MLQGNSTALAKNCTDPTVPDCAWPADSFPQGLKAFRKTVGEDKTIWVHAGLWTSGSPYRTKYEFASGARGEETPPQGEPPRYRCHLGCILLKMAAISWRLTLRRRLLAPRAARELIFRPVRAA